MNYKVIFAVALAMCLVQSINGFNVCPCKAKGIDVCSCNKVIARPKPIQLPPIPLTQPRTVCETIQPPRPMQPIGDLCYGENCQNIVTPAPRPYRKSSVQYPVNKLIKASIDGTVKGLNSLLSIFQCNHKDGQCSKSSSSSSSSSTSQSMFNNEDIFSQSSYTDTMSRTQPIRAPVDAINVPAGRGIYFETEKQQRSQKNVNSARANADAVSVALAQRLSDQMRIGAKEKHLQFGSINTPIRAYDVKEWQDIPEEKMYEYQGDILEINSDLFNQNNAYSEEQEQSDEESYTVKPEAFRPLSLQYGSIGYNVAAKPNHQYIPITNVASKSHSYQKHSKLSTTKSSASTSVASSSSSSCGCSQNQQNDQYLYNDNHHSYDENSSIDEEVYHT